MNSLTLRLFVALLIGALAAGGYVWWQQRQSPAPEPERAADQQAAAPAPAAPVEPAIKHPIDALPAAGAAAAVELPPLDQSDAFVTGALTDLVGRKAALSSLQLDGFVRRAVATVDNLARSHAAPRLWPINPIAGRFTVDKAGGDTVIGAANEQRYVPFVQFVESIDTGRAVALYVRLYPLFQRAFEELGYPGRYFNDRLVAVIDHLLATPSPRGPLKVELTKVKGPVESARPWVRYEFTDPALESLSAGQKMLLRAGPANAQRLKAKLAQVRSQIAVVR